MGCELCACVWVGGGVRRAWQGSGTTQGRRRVTLQPVTMQIVGRVGPRGPRTAPPPLPPRRVRTCFPSDAPSGVPTNPPPPPPLAALQRRSRASAFSLGHSHDTSSFTKKASMHESAVTRPFAPAAAAAASAAARADAEGDGAAAVAAAGAGVVAAGGAPAGLPLLPLLSLLPRLAALWALPSPAAAVSPAAAAAAAGGAAPSSRGNAGGAPATAFASASASPSSGIAAAGEGHTGNPPNSGRAPSSSTATAAAAANALRPAAGTSDGSRAAGAGAGRPAADSGGGDGAGDGASGELPPAFGPRVESRSRLPWRLPQPSSAESCPLAVTPSDPRLPNRRCVGRVGAGSGGGVIERPAAAAAEGAGGGDEPSGRAAPAEGAGEGSRSAVEQASEASDGVAARAASLEPAQSGCWRPWGPACAAAPRG